MKRFKTKNYFDSFKYARKGFLLAMRSQRNFRIELLTAVVVFFLAWVFQFSAIEFCILILTTVVVLVAELFNSVIEFSFDAYYRHKYSHIVKMAKDISAGAVMLTAFSSIAIGIVLFSNKIFN